MKSLFSLPLAALLVFALAGSAFANCYADYKAKRDNPLRLHYGVIELPNEVCGDLDLAAAEIARRISVDHWQLLTVLSIFGKKGLKKREKSAGKYFLRY